MHQAFEMASSVEAEGMQLLLPFLAAEHPQYLLTAGTGSLSMRIQKTVGDVLVRNGNGLLSIEVKVEAKNKHGNFFLETWSNRKWFTPGWMFTTNCDRLWYFFLEERELYSIDFGKLRTWAFIDSKIYAHEEKPQKKYDQRNDTWGRCVPIGTVRDEVGFEREETIFVT